MSANCLASANPPVFLKPIWKPKPETKSCRDCLLAWTDVSDPVYHVGPLEDQPIIPLLETVGWRSVVQSQPSVKTDDRARGQWAMASP